jgi:hypothetical protein
MLADGAAEAADGGCSPFAPFPALLAASPIVVLIAYPNASTNNVNKVSLEIVFVFLTKRPCTLRHIGK